MPTDPIPIGRQNQNEAPFSGSAVGLSTSNPGSMFSKWSAFSPLKSPSTQQAPQMSSMAGHAPDDHDPVDHDEFGDLSELRTRGWAAAAAARGQRRAVSLSMSPGTSLLNNQQTSPTSTSSGSPPSSFTGHQFMNDKMSRGEGVLRRLSLGGGFGGGRVSTLTGRSGPVVPPPSSDVHSTMASAPKHDMSQQGPASAPAPPMGQRGRRYSESTGRRRRVSPTGERILRDQMHF